MRKRRGTLTFEWLVLAAILVIGVMNGIFALRTALNRTAEVIPENICNMNSAITDSAITN